MSAGRRRYGFGGGLVPGVDVYAYMTRPAVAAWGVDWLSGGTMHARFLSPVYEGQVVVVTCWPVGAPDCVRSLLAVVW